jgi:Zn-dependent protease
MLLHEAGHLFVAQRKHCKVLSIRLYPVFGITYFEIPWSRLDHCLIAWGGVLAQAIVFVPLVTWVAFFGYTRVELLNMVFAILGFFSLGVAILNLLPVPPLDGAIAWTLPAAIMADRRSRVVRRPIHR